MNILFIGDIFGRPGRDAVKKVLPELRKQHEIDLVIANAENMHHGKGVSEPLLLEMRAAGVDFFTSGNHVWKIKEIIPRLNDKDLPLIRPANYPQGATGRGFELVTTASGEKVLVINLMGRVFMNMQLDCPFHKADEILKKFESEKFDAVFVDFHAEATSEKAALGHYLDGRVTAVIGTHTHVPTFDARILNGGTAFQTDVGFTGPIDSIIGLEKKGVIENFLTQVPTKHEVAKGQTVFNAIKIKVAGGKAVMMEQIQKYL